MCHYSRTHTDTRKYCLKCYYKIPDVKPPRREIRWRKRVLEQFGDDYLLGADRATQYLGGCSLKRPDLIFVGEDRVIVVEYDEYEHLWGNYDYTCEESRLCDIHGNDPRHLLVIRYNPDEYDGPKVKTADRIERFIEQLRKVSTMPLDDVPRQYIWYMFYSSDNPLFAQNIPWEHV